MGNEAWDDYRLSKVQSRSQVQVEVNGAIGTIVTMWDIILFGKWIVFIPKIFFSIITNNMPLLFEGGGKEDFYLSK